MSVKIVKNLNLLNFTAPSGESVFSVAIDITPVVTYSNFAPEQFPRLKVNGVEKAISSYSISKSDSGIGISGTFTLQNPADRTAITRDALITFDYVDKDDVLIKNIFTDAKITNKNFTIEDGGSYSFSCVSDAGGKLSLCPSTNLVIYDPDKVSFDADDLEPTYDGSGNSYTAEDLPISGLTLAGVLNEILVNRCGFTAVQTNIPAANIPIRRADFEDGVPFFDGLKPLLGMYDRPQFIEKPGGVIEINDKTAEMANGFPSVRELTFFGITGGGVSRTESDAGWIEIVFSAPDGYDFITSRPVVRQEQYTEPETGDLITTQILGNVWEFRFSYMPNVVQKEELQAELRTTYRGGIIAANKLHQTNTFNQFDNQGRLIYSQVTTGERVPDLENEGEFIFEESTEVRINEIEFAQHPTRLKKQFLKSITSQSTGLATKDTSNPFAWNRTPGEFTQSLAEAQIGGNIASGQEYVTNKVLRRYTETFTPDRNIVKHRRTAFDGIQGKFIYDRTDPRIGDVSVGAAAGRALKIKIAENEGETIPATGRKLTVAVDLLPLKFAVPLARRRFKKQKYFSGEAVFNVAYIDLSIDIGAWFEAKDVDNNSEGFFISTGWTHTGRALDDGTIDMQMSVTGEELILTGDDVLLIHSSAKYAASYADEPLEFSFIYDVPAGFQFRLETALSIASVEIKEEMDAGWTDLEAGNYDLSAFVGAKHLFYVRVTPDTPREIGREILTIRAESV